MFIEIANYIDRRWSGSFFKQWGYEWKYLVTILDAPKSTSSQSYRGRRDGAHYGILDTKLSDIYRVAFYRALAWAVHKGHVPGPDAQQICLDTCPVNRGLLKVATAGRPVWWPTPHISGGKIDNIPASVWSSLSLAWGNRESLCGERMLGRVSGRVYETSTLAYDLEIIAALQLCNGPDHPTDEEVFCSLAESPELPLTGNSFDLSFLMRSVDPADTNVSLGGWKLTPISFRYCPMFLGGWQWNKIARLISTPYPYFLQKALILEPKGGHLVSISNGEERSRWNDWSCGNVEQMIANLPPPIGDILTLSKDYLNLLGCEGAYIWACRLDCFYRDHSYREEFKTHSEFRVFGAEKLVRSSVR